MDTAALQPESVSMNTCWQYLESWIMSWEVYIKDRVPANFHLQLNPGIDCWSRAVSIFTATSIKHQEIFIKGTCAEGTFLSQVRNPGLLHFTYCISYISEYGGRIVCPDMSNSGQQILERIYLLSCIMWNIESFTRNCTHNPYSLTGWPRASFNYEGFHWEDWK